MNQGRKLLSLLLSLLLCLSLFPVALAEEPEGSIAPAAPDGEGAIVPAGDGGIAEAASGLCGEDLRWTLDESGVLCISGTGDMWSRSTETPLWEDFRDRIFSVVMEHGITGIGNCAFQDCQNLSSVSIPDGVREIGFYAFASCSSLTALTIPEGVKVLGYFPFQGCSALIEVAIPGSVTRITPHLNGQGLFGGCDSLREIRFGGTMAAWESLGANADRYRVTVHCSDGDIAAAAAASCGDALTWSLSEEGVLSIAGSGDMWDYEQATSPWYESSGQIRSLCIASGVTGIGDYAFAWCWNLKEAEVPVTLSRIGDHAFESCSALGSLALPEGLRSIGAFPFSGCTSLAQLRIPESVTDIDADAFSLFSGLLRVTLPRDPGNGAALDFCDCRGMTDIEYTGTMAQWQQLTVLYPRAQVTIHCSDGEIPPVSPDRCGDELSWSLSSDGVLSIAGSGDMWDFPKGTAPWYDNCAQIRQVLLPPGLTGIGAYAFSECFQLSGLTLPEGLRRIGACAFRSCTALTGITIPAAVTSLAPGAFEYCQSLAEICVAPDNPCLFSEDGALYDRETGTLLCWPCAKSGAALIPDGMTRIGDGAFGFCAGLTGIILPEGLLSIGDSAFTECRALTAVTLPASVTHLGSLSFSFCSALREIRFCGPAPDAGGFVFYRVSATAYYPAGDPSWTAERRQSYDGNITWVPYLPGDANGDGSLDILDLVRLSKHLAGADAAVNGISAELNGDGQLTVRDLVRLRRLLVGEPG